MMQNIYRAGEKLPLFKSLHASSQHENIQQLILHEEVKTHLSNSDAGQICGAIENFT